MLHVKKKVARDLRSIGQAARRGDVGGGREAGHVRYNEDGESEAPAASEQAWSGPGRGGRWSGAGAKGCSLEEPEGTGKGKRRHQAEGRRKQRMRTREEGRFEAAQSVMKGSRPDSALGEGGAPEEYGGAEGRGCCGAERKAEKLVDSEESDKEKDNIKEKNEGRNEVKLVEKVVQMWNQAAIGAGEESDVELTDEAVVTEEAEKKEEQNEEESDVKSVEEVVEIGNQEAIEVGEEREVELTPRGVEESARGGLVPDGRIEIQCA